MRIAYATDYDAQNIANWSGLGVYIAKSLLNQGLEIDYITASDKKSPLSIQVSIKLKYLFYKHLLKKDHKKDRDLPLLRDYARQITSSLKQSNAQLIFSTTPVPLSFLDSKLPIAFWNDATFSGLIGFYPMFMNLCEETIRDGKIAEQAALDRCRLAIYSSDWAAQSAIKDYSVDPEKVKVVPFGANLDCDRDLSAIKQIIDSKPQDHCNLLFIGVEWYRKGGDVALRVTQLLNEQGLKTKLTIVGCHPPDDVVLPDFVECLGFISKASSEGVKTINKLFYESHFFILPSRAECYGIVFCEANSFGVPCISTDVGGIPSVIKDNINGHLFSLDADVSKLCDYISNLFINYDDYKNLALSSFNEYQSRLNWSVAGRAVKKLLFECL